MFFAFSVSPKQPVKKPILQAPVEEIAELKLAPFAANPKIFFEDVKIGNSVTKKLLIKNPMSFKYKLTVTKLPPAARSVVISWVETEVEAESDVLLELTWTPREEGSWRDILTIVDSRNVKRDIAVVFKSIAKKAKRRTVGTKPKSTIGVKAFKSPIKKFRSPKDIKKKRSPIKIPEIFFPSNGKIISPSVSDKKLTFILESDKENSPIPCRNATVSFKSAELSLRDNTYALNATTNLSPCTKQTTPRRKHTYLVHSDKHISPMYSPLSERNASDLSLGKLSFIEKINQLNNSSVFTSPSNANFKGENIPPTPIRRETYNINYQPVIQIVSPTFSDCADNLNDSLELERKIKELNYDTSREISFTCRRRINSNKSDDLLMKLQSESFAFTPITKNPTNLLTLIPSSLKSIEDVSTTPFNPTNCSTEMKLSGKSRDSNISEHASNPRALFKANNTYELSPNDHNLSTGTYTHNISGGTFSMGNLSSSTCIVLSPEFKDGINNKILTESDKLLGCNQINTSSPVPQFPTSQVETNSNYMLNFSGVNARAALSCITEEDVASETHSFVSARNVSVQSNTAASKRKSNQQIETVFAVSPPKRAFIKPKSPVQRKLNSSWSKKLVKPDFTRKRPLSTLRLSLNTSNPVKQKPAEVNTSITSNSTYNCDPFLIATIYSDSTVSSSQIDPFISSTLYYDEKWLDKQTNELKKWLNALLTPPTELNARAESKKVDVAKLWQDCIKKDLTYAPTKEKVSSLYHTNHRLDGLRKAARIFFHSIEMKTVLSRVTLSVENKHLAIRDDKNLHLDVGLQSHVMMLLLCYNPLWLRIGLETVYGETIPLDSNSDVIGLSTFIMLRFFRDPYLMPKHKASNVHNLYLPTYATSIKKFSLKKFLMLVYFLDQAKSSKLMAHDPCLFCRDAPVKESRELLLSFARELLSAIGDITKFLRRLGYAVCHKQSYIDEFDYAVKNLGVDLRDGIRLTKVMEIISLKPNLSSQLRGPAISRLQKIHNVKVAMDSLTEAGYEIVGDITPKDIVDGHREKTLSLLWQIIYKFQAPRFSNAAVKIQVWWRSLSIVIKRRILYKPYLRKINAATKIQRFYRARKLMSVERAKFLRFRAAAIVIQCFTRSLFLVKRDRLQYLVKRQAVLIIQQKYRAIKRMREQRQHYLQLKHAAAKIQRYFRATRVMKQIRTDYLQLKRTVIQIQRIFRARKVAKTERAAFVQKRNAAVVIQRFFKTTLMMRAERERYLQRKEACVTLQRYVRATLAMRKERRHYLELRSTVIWVQKHARSLKTMAFDRSRFMQQKQAVVLIQRYFRTTIVMRKESKQYVELKQTVLLVQQRFRANVDMKKCRQDYLHLKQSTVILQHRFRANKEMKQVREMYIQQRRAALILQQHFRAGIAMKKCRQEYRQLIRIVVKLQQRFRASKAMKQTREIYIQQRKATIVLQQHFRAHRAMKQAKEAYLQQRRAVILIQQHFKAHLAMKQCKHAYLQQRKASIIIQQWNRSIIVMRQTRTKYIQQKQAAVTIQRQYRANQARKQDRQAYVEQRKAIIMLQQRFRANLAVKHAREIYLKQKQAAIIIQQRFRATLAMKQDKETYVKQRNAIIELQQRFRAILAMKKARQEYLRRRQAITIIQNWFRAAQQMKAIREMYLQKKRAAITIQQRFRATLVMKHERAIYMKQRRATVVLQKRFRATVMMRKAREAYLEQRQATILIQNWLRTTHRVRQVREHYLKQKQATITIQRRFRATLAMKHDKETYMKQRRSIILAQQRFRATLVMKEVRTAYLQQRQAVIIIQTWFRSIRTMTLLRTKYLEQRQAVILIQQRFRTNLLMKQARQNYLKQRQAAIIIQQRFRANLCTKQTRTSYLQQRHAIMILQQRFRANVAMKRVREDYIQYRRAAVIFQRHFRANVAMKNTRRAFLNLRNGIICIQRGFRNKMVVDKERHQCLLENQSACVIQRYFRRYLQMQQQRRIFLKMRESTMVIQRYVRSYLVMKEVRKLFVVRKVAMIKIQRYYRGYLLMRNDRTDFLLKKNKVILIQKWFRAYLHSRRLDEENRKLKAAITIQSWIRMRGAKKLLKTLQENAIETEEKKKLRNIVAAVIKIQAVWRGYKVRCVENEKLTLIRQRTIEANKRALPELTAGERNREAIEILTYDYHTSMKEIIRALTVLDFTTRLFPQACIALRHKIVERLYLVLASTNRSVPDMDACVLSISVLINLLKYKHTSAAVWKPNFLDILLHTTLQWSNKEGLLFPYVCTLLWLLAQNPEHSKEILKEQNAEKILLKAYQECERKQKMLSRLKNTPANTIQKQGIGAKTWLKKPTPNEDKSFILSKTICHTPSLKPDWGIINNKHPRTFLNPIFAIKCLLKKLNIAINQ